jgi:tellurite resistance protein TehA-like permease
MKVQSSIIAIVIIGFVCIISGAYAKVNHIPMLQPLMLVGILMHFIVMIYILISLFNKVRNNK